MTPTVSLNGGDSTFWMQCSKPNCPTYVNTYIPSSYQYAMHEDPAREILAAGGFGSGKTLWDYKDAEKHMLITPSGRSLFGAPTYPQLNATLKKDFEDDFPVDLVRDIRKQDKELTLINQHEVIYRSFDDQHKLRSLNLSAFSIAEASGAKYSIFSQLQNRLRNTAAVIFERDENGDIVFESDKNGDPRPVIKVDWRRGRSESNPDPGWVKTEFLERSGTVHLYGDEIKDETYDFRDVNPNFSTHIVPTSANQYLPPNYEEEQAVGKPDWWKRRYFKGSFRYAEGMVYPNYSDHIVEPFKIPRHWKRVIAMDYGINDNTHFVFGALDTKNSMLYIYDELVISDANVRTISNEYKKKLRQIPAGALLTTPVMDQRSMAKRQSHDVDVKLGDLFADENLMFDPAQMDMDSRILRTSTLLDLGQIKFFNTCTGLLTELKNYKYPSRELDKPNKDVSKPEDKFNHGANALEFLVMELPPNLEKIDLNAYTKSGRALQNAVAEDYYRLDKPSFNPLKQNKNTDAYSIHYGGDIDDGNPIEGPDDIVDDFIDDMENH